MAELSKWLVTVNLDESIQKVRKRLEEEGLVIDSLLAEVGCITGQANQETAARLRKITGVLDVSPDVEIKLPAPSDETTW